ncbi:valine--tRNA ligase [Halobacteriales archaeon QS_3_64_16]|nr:MAG: valine--tRNA ligase [Halobacteriales archaeon QS_3_64_16]
MTEIPETYDPDAIEPKWRDQWAGSDLYRYERSGEGSEEDREEADDIDAADTPPESDRPDYVIDTPPPYPTGDFHIGNALGWCYMDFAARYHRLQGENVLFPQGWDCHGLPTEVKVEENKDTHRTDVSREQFREWCTSHTETQIDSMKATMDELGLSQDWSAEFRTMDPEYWGRTQRSFAAMAEDDYVYRDEHPVNWCPRCETAIADAEVEAIDRGGALYYVSFPGAGEDADTDTDAEDGIEIATTRPELMAACVAIAVHPEDDRYDGRAGETVEVPLFGQDVEILADSEVDPDFGTGAVMICTFGDKQDVSWWQEYDLPLRQVFTEDGRLTEDVAEFGGLEIGEAKERIATELQKSGHLDDEEPVEQSVGACWRCDTPIEILSKEQWFVRVDTEEILDKAQDVEWIPAHAYSRLEDWADGMEWDWVISRQRVFATPIPAWFCAECGHVHVADSEDLPVEPTEEDPEIDSCPECGASDWAGETDVMDTWMDSSISPLFVSGWPEESFSPVSLRPQGHDIIRTWAFYTLLRTAALEDQVPWEEALIHGMVFGEDGNKMSKSRDNFVQPEEVVEKHSADAFRQAIALGGQPGSDIQFQPKEVTSAARFLTKTWNITRFATDHLEEDLAVEDPAYRDADRWILSRCSQVASEVARDMDDYRFDRALRELREFVWHDLADDYVELIKGRLYEGRPGERDAARHALATVLEASLRMLAPFAPFLAEEAYSHLPGTEGSVHATVWPALDAHDEDAQQRGALIAAVASEVRAWKSETGRALNADLERIEIYPEGTDHLDTYDLSETVGAPIYVEAGRPNVELVPVDVEPDHSVIGPEFRDRAGAVVSALEDSDPGDLKRQLEHEDEIELDTNGEVVVLDSEAIEVQEEPRAGGEEVAVLETDSATVLIFP